MEIEHWLVWDLGMGGWLMLDFKGMETLNWKIFCEINLELLALIWLKDTIFDNKTTPHLNIIMAIKKLLYFPHHLYYLFGEKLVWCNMSIT